MYSHTELFWTCVFLSCHQFYILSYFPLALKHCFNFPKWINNDSSYLNRVCTMLSVAGMSQRFEKVNNLRGEQTLILYHCCASRFSWIKSDLLILFPEQLLWNQNFYTVVKETVFVVALTSANANTLNQVRQIKLGFSVRRVFIRCMSPNLPWALMRFSSIFRQGHQDNANALLSSSLLLCMKCKWRQSDCQGRHREEMAWTIIKVKKKLDREREKEGEDY